MMKKKTISAMRLKIVKVKKRVCVEYWNVVEMKSKAPPGDVNIQRNMFKQEADWVD